LIDRFICRMLKDACLLVLCGHHVRAEPWCELPPHVFHEIPRADAEALKDCFGCGEICEDDRAPEWWRAMVLKGGLDIG
jgi:hypothetical protein